ncbi:hypothetical protein B0H17DRAFT_1211921 [Mycena rosella]|uniref:F-box domain-containing protein n=1 Tax=Mycena rosella TaxID=1033263 RepID=A0AAD7G6V5_MYCRO|nr:hypothetical protein B0H17DRAFT_1211921 [Mycena rosella]
MLLLNVCHNWTDIAISTPALWTAIHASKLLVDLASLMDAWLKRAGSCALFITLPQSLPDEVAAVVGRHVQQLHTLRLFHADADTDLVAGVGPFPFLETLTIVGLPDSESEQYAESTGTTMEMLRVCPNLVEWTLEDVFYRNAGSSPLTTFPRGRLHSAIYLFAHFTDPSFTFSGMLFAAVGTNQVWAT